MGLFRRKKLERGFGPLTFLAGLLLISSILRFAGGPAAAIAKEVSDIRTSDGGASQPMHCEQPSDVANVLAALSEREARLDNREEVLARRADTLAEAEIKIKKQLDALLAAESELQATLTVAANAAEDDVAMLTAVYENMKPKEAARLFETMAPEFAAGFLGRMRPDFAAKVVEGLTPEVAYSISVILAGRNANAPKE